MSFLSRSLILFVLAAFASGALQPAALAQTVASEEPPATRSLKADSIFDASGEPPAPASDLPASAPSPNISQASRSTNPETSNPETSDPETPNPETSSVVVSAGQDANLPGDRRAEAVVSVLGSSRSAGEVSDAVVSIFGDNTITGPVGDSAVAVFGNLFIDSEVRGDAVAVFGDMTLGPHAIIHGEAVVVGGRLLRDPRAVVYGGVQEIKFGARLGSADWLRPWVEHGLLYGRPLALVPGFGWAWALTLGSLVIYVLVSLLFGTGVSRCVETLERHPGQSLITSLLAVLLLPVLLLLLLVTVVGIAVVPFILLGVFCASIFGKSVVLAALGRRVTAFAGSSADEGGALGNIALATLIGGILITSLYLVPVLGFITFNVVGILGLGTVLYTMLLLIRARPARNAQDSGATATTGIGTGASQASAAASAEAAPRPGGTIPAGNAGSPQPESSGPDATAGPAPFAPPQNAQPQGAGTVLPGPLPEARPSASMLAALPRAGFSIRMLALLIDIVLVAIIMNMLSDGNLFLLVLAAYGAVMWKLKGTTIGGIICHLKVVRLDGHEFGWDTAIVRALSCFLSLAIVGLGFFWIMFDDERQSWHDKIAGTIVVRSPRGTPLL